MLTGVAVDETPARRSASCTSSRRGRRSASTTGSRRRACEAGAVYFCAGYGICDAATIAGARQHAAARADRRERVDRSLGRSRQPDARLHGACSTSSTRRTATGSTFEHNRVRGGRVVLQAVRRDPAGLRRRRSRRRCSRFHARAGIVRPLDSDRAALGVTTPARGSLHPRTLFYAGGMQSVRGFAENELGPRVLQARRASLLAAGCTARVDRERRRAIRAACRTISCSRARPAAAASSRGTSSCACRSRRALSGVAFVDGAHVGDERTRDDRRQAKGAVTPGFGFRYRSPLGVLRLDFGLRPVGEELLPVVVADAGRERATPHRAARAGEVVLAGGGSIAGHVALDRAPDRRALRDGAGVLMAQPIPRSRTPPAPQAPTPPHAGARDRCGRCSSSWCCRSCSGSSIVLVLAITPWGNERVRRLLVSQANDRMNGHARRRRAAWQSASRARRSPTCGSLDSARRPLFTARRVQVQLRAAAGAARATSWCARSSLDTAGRAARQAARRALELPVADEAEHARRRTRRSIARRPSCRTSRSTTAASLYRRPWRPDTTLTRRPARFGDRRGARRQVAQRAWSECPADSSACSTITTSTRGCRRCASRTTASRPPWRSRRCRCSASPIAPPAIDVRSLVGTLYASKDSLWWRGARMSLPGSRVSRRRHDQVPADGLLARSHRRAGLVRRSAVAQSADCRRPAAARCATRCASTATTTTHRRWPDADVRYRDATIVGDAAITRVHPKGEATQLLVDGADLTVARLSTDDHPRARADARRCARAARSTATSSVSGPTRDLRLDADVDVRRRERGTQPRRRARWRGARSARLARATSRCSCDRCSWRRSTGAGVQLPARRRAQGNATVSGARCRAGGACRGDLSLVDRGARSRVIGSGSYAARQQADRGRRARSRRSRSRR